MLVKRGEPPAKKVLVEVEDQRKGPKPGESAHGDLEGAGPVDPLPDRIFRRPILDESSDPPAIDGVAGNQKSAGEGKQELVAGPLPSPTKVPSLPVDFSGFKDYGNTEDLPLFDIPRRQGLTNLVRSGGTKKKSSFEGVAKQLPPGNRPRRHLDLPAHRDLVAQAGRNLLRSHDR